VALTEVNSEQKIATRCRKIQWIDQKSVKKIYKTLNKKPQRFVSG